MSKKDWIGIIYVSIVIMIWGTIGSLIDYPLLQIKLYNAGSLGQITTFFATGLFSAVIAILLFKRVTNKFLD